MILINSSPKNALKIFQPFLPIFVPVGVGSLLACAQAAGIKAGFIDEQFEDNILGAVKEYVKEIPKPYIFGFSVLTIALKEAITLSKELKRFYPDSIILFGGIHPTAMPEEILGYDHIDVVLRGEAEETLIDFYRCIKTRRDYTGLPNISYRKNGRIIHNSAASAIADLDKLPDFPYRLFDSRRYDLGFIISSRGCPYNCIFCSNRITTNRSYRFRSAQKIIDELDLLHHQYKRNYVVFVDDNLLVNKERIYAIIDGIKRKGLHKKMVFNFQARGDNVNYKLLKELYGSGFRSIFFGLETSSEEIMKAIKKNETVAQCIEAVRMAKSIGFYVSATFIYGLPGETHEDRMSCVRLSRELKLDMVRYNNATPYPGTELYELARREQRLNIQGLYENFLSVSTFIESPFKKIPFSYVPQGNSEKAIRRDLLFSYFSFYFDLNKIKTILTRPERGVGWFNAGEDVIKILKNIPRLMVLFFLLGFKFFQLFHYMVIDKESAISFKYFLKVFQGLWKNRDSRREVNQKFIKDDRVYSSEQR